MSELTSPLSLLVYGTFFLIGTLHVFTPVNRTLSTIGLVIVSLVAALLRIEGIRYMFKDRPLGFSSLANTFFLHVILFSSLFIILMDDYTIQDPTNTLMDAVYYSVDTTTTNGASGIVPSSTTTKTFHTINLLDSYLLLITLGFYVIKNVSAIAG
jgi:hypothetical protein